MLFELLRALHIVNMKELVHEVILIMVRLHNDIHILLVIAANDLFSYLELTE